jgi:hypothetical protein
MKQSMALTAAIAAVLSQKFVGGAEVVQRDPETFASPVPTSDDYSRPRTYSHFDPLQKKKEVTRKRKKIAKASRKRNRK